MNDRLGEPEAMQPVHVVESESQPKKEMPKPLFKVYEGLGSDADGKKVRILSLGRLSGSKNELFVANIGNFYKDSPFHDALKEIGKTGVVHFVNPVKIFGARLANTLFDHDDVLVISTPSIDHVKDAFSKSGWPMTPEKSVNSSTRLPIRDIREVTEKFAARNPSATEWLNRTIARVTKNDIEKPGTIITDAKSSGKPKGPEGKQL